MMFIHGAAAGHQETLESMKPRRKAVIRRERDQPHER